MKKIIEFIKPEDRIILALDVDSEASLLDMLEKTAGVVSCFKIGLELINSVGGSTAVKLVKKVTNGNCKIFYDGKLFDIPNTMAGATKAIVGLGVEMFDVHASARTVGMEAAVKNSGDSLVLAVTVLTSFNDSDSTYVYGQSREKAVLKLIREAVAARVDGVVCSALEAKMVKSEPLLKHLLTVVPGIRPSWMPAGDQKAIMTPHEAIVNGADMLVIGRAITNPPSHIGSPKQAVELISEEIAKGLEVKDRGGVPAPDSTEVDNG